MKSSTLNRRAVLRGALGVSMALPWLETFDAKPARGAASTNRRFVTFFQGGGSFRERWRPNGTEEAASAALLLAESPEEPATLVMSPRSFVLNRVMRCDEPGPVQKFKLLRIVQRGGDFERVAFEPVDPNF